MKKEIYAEAGIAIYWIVNLVDCQIEFHSPTSGPAQQFGYAACDIYVAGRSVPVGIDGREVGRIAVTDVLP